MSIDTAPAWRFPEVSVVAVRRSIQAVGFWLAVALPLVYLPLVSVTSIGTDPGVLLTALATNLFALVLGHGHEPSLDRTD